MANRSTTPKKLLAYRLGSAAHHRRVMYSTVNRSVNAHSSTYSTRCVRAESPATLSAITTATLPMMAMINAMSNRAPALVS